MITISGIYDGVKIIPTQKTPASKTSRVEITFYEEMTTTREEDMHRFFSTTIFDFWGNERDDFEVTSLNEK
jgi:CRISPR/Cas system CMR-associated protein Cmr3 (group 5 of RAMP superfamily)